MSEECTHDCSTCGSNCSERETEQESFLESPNPNSSIKKVIGIVSGKGGVGKSMVTSLMALGLRMKGYNTAILDADITGPSIPKIFGLKEKAYGVEQGILPVKTRTGIDVMSINLLVEDESDPVIWRGPVLAGVVKQFWSDVIWEDVDFMFVDMPPGTGDVPLTVFQSLPLDGIIIVTSPQELVSMIVEKAYKMAQTMKIPVLGIVENMSYIECPDCGKKIPVFGESTIDSVAERFGIETVDKMPIIPKLAGMCDAGELEENRDILLENMLSKVEGLLIS